MRICIISPERSPWGGIGHSLRDLATLLASRHEVTLIHSGAEEGTYRPEPALGVREVIASPSGELAEMEFSCEEHRASAAVLEAIERAYRDSQGPDYLEVCDYRAQGLVPLQARRAGHPLLRKTLVGVRLSGTVELISLHDGTVEYGMRIVSDLEREQFRLADRLLWRGGDTLDLYRRYYSDLELPEAVRIRPPTPAAGRGSDPPPAEADAPLRLLYVGRLQRFKGAIELVEACLGLPRDDWELTMIGADTKTGPIGYSTRSTIEVLCRGDPRIRLEGPCAHEELQGRWAEHDLLVIPSLFEPWSNVAIEAMLAGLPILATPVGGPAEIVDPGVTGWHTDGLGPDSLRRALCELLEDRDEIERVRASGAVGERVRALTEPGSVTASYEELLATARPPRAPGSPGREPPVTAIVPYHCASAYVEAAVRSLLGQTHRNLDVVIVNDGSFEPEDEVLTHLSAEPRVTVVTQLNRGEPAARNLGAALATGDYLALLDADNVLEPDFVARAVAILENEPVLAYVTCWLSQIDPSGSPRPGGYAPLGNSVSREQQLNWDGDALAVLRRELFSELGYRYEPSAALASDWELYRVLRGGGRFGAVIPERLARYRVVSGSLSRIHEEWIHTHAWDESKARLRLRSTRWTAGA